MSTNQQLELSTFIKSIHKKLREETKRIGQENAWRKHCQDDEVLKQYSSAMKELASIHWSRNEQKENSRVTSRTDWIYKNCMAYFRDGGLEYQRKRELDIANRNELHENKNEAGADLHENNRENELSLDSFKNYKVGIDSCKVDNDLSHLYKSQTSSANDIEININSHGCHKTNIDSDECHKSNLNQDLLQTSMTDGKYAFSLNYKRETNVKCKLLEAKHELLESKLDNKLLVRKHKLLENNKYKLLDVGSCYNPLKIHEEFDILPIDLAPATEEVLQCDFLNVKTTDHAPEHNTPSKITELQTSSFHIVVFCLLLEYLPTPQQRLECCERAYELLKSEGLLVVLTPDSKHVGKNARFMKSWRYVLARLGFCRIKYEKLTYVHCMLFRKSSNPRVAKRWAEMNRDRCLYDGICIPQDFNTEIREFNSSDENCILDNQNKC